MKANKNQDRLINFRPLFAAAAGFVCGIAFAARAGFGGALPKGAAFYFALAVPLAAVVLAAVGAIRNNRWLTVVPVFVLLGILRVQLFSPYDDGLLVSDNSKSSVVEGVVVSYDATDAHAKLALKDASVNGQSAKHRIMLLSQPEEARGVSVGDRIRTECSSIAVPGTVYGSYNERLQRLAEGVSLRGYAQKIKVISHDNAPVIQLFSKTRDAIARTIDNTFGSNAPLVKGFILGIKTDIPDETYSNYVNGGISHVLTLSGFHVGVLTAILCFVFPKRKRFLRAAAVSVILLLYCSVTGFSPSLTRASVMCVCAVSASAFARRSDALSSLSLSALIILFANPFRLCSLGFLLTFAATLGIILISSFNVGGDKKSLVHRFKSSAAVTLGASAATTLISAAAFGCFYPYNIISNLVCVPLLAFAITVSFVITALAFVLPGFSALAAAVPNAVYDAVEWLLSRISLLPYSKLAAFRPSAISCVLALLLLFSTSAYVLRTAKTRLKYGACVLLLFTASVFVDIIRL